MDPLQQLRDIHLPEAVSWWPPAPLWWVLLCLLLAGLLVLGWWALRSWRRRAYRRVACRELEARFGQWQRDGDHRGYLEAVNAILKRAALCAFPRAEVAALNGEAWGAFLDAQLPAASDHSLASGPLGASYYSPTDPDPATLEALQQKALHWLRRHRSRP